MGESGEGRGEATGPAQRLHTAQLILVPYVPGVGVPWDMSGEGWTASVVKVR